MRPYFPLLRCLGIAAGAMLAAILVACETLTPSAPPPPPVVARAEQPPAPEIIPPPPRKPRPAVRRVTPATPPPSSDAPIMLVGLSRKELATTLGEPAERIDRNPGQAWVYRASPCAVEVLFLLDVVRNDLFSIDRKVTGTDGTPRGEQQCLQRIKSAHGS